MARQQKDKKPLQVGSEHEDLAQANSYLDHLPPINVGALFMPPIWGPGHGFWLAVLWYPLWILVDDILYMCWSQPSTTSLVAAIGIVVLMVIATVVFARWGQAHAALRAVRAGKTLAELKHAERIWTVVDIALGIIFVAFATYYNLTIRPTLGA